MNKMWKEHVMVNFKTLYQHLPAVMEENVKKLIQDN